jgi:hypothetical protein
MFRIVGLKYFNFVTLDIWIRQKVMCGRIFNLAKFDLMRYACPDALPLWLLSLLWLHSSRAEVSKPATRAGRSSQR